MVSPSDKDTVGSAAQLHESLIKWFDVMNRGGQILINWVCIMSDAQFFSSAGNI